MILEDLVGRILIELADVPWVFLKTRFYSRSQVDGLFQYGSVPSLKATSANYIAVPIFCSSECPLIHLNRGCASPFDFETSFVQALSARISVNYPEYNMDAHLIHPCVAKHPGLAFYLTKRLAPAMRLVQTPVLRAYRQQLLCS